MYPNSIVINTVYENLHFKNLFFKFNLSIYSTFIYMSINNFIAGTWSILTNPINIFEDKILLLKYGSIICQDFNFNSWHKIKTTLAKTYLKGARFSITPLTDTPHYFNNC